MGWFVDKSAGGVAGQITHAEALCLVCVFMGSPIPTQGSGDGGGDVQESAGMHHPNPARSVIFGEREIPMKPIRV